MMMKSLALGGLLAMGMATTGFAQNMLTAADVDAILDIARGYGDAEIGEQSNGDPKISVTLADVNGKDVTYQVYFRSCDDDNANCEDIQFYAGFLDVQPGIERANEWNLTKRFGKSYIDGDGDACIEWDIDLVAGVSEEYLSGAFDLWGQVLDQYTAFVDF
ncbi:MAG: YbjN protein [Devosia sp.]|nr:YbjN protein [Devosia sp.]